MAPRSPQFLERDTYRYRRAVDAARLLPVLGVMLWLIPAVWSQSPDAQTPLSQAMLYIFLVWLGLIVLCAIVASRIAKRSFGQASAQAMDQTDPKRLSDPSAPE